MLMILQINMDVYFFKTYNKIVANPISAKKQNDYLKKFKF